MTLGLLLVIAREWKTQGSPGSRPVIAALPGIPVNLIRRVVAGLKLNKRRRYEWRRAQVRTSVIVNHPGSVCSMDGATVEKGDDFIVYRDRGSLSVNADQCGGHAKSENTIKVLITLKESGRLPLVLCTDNGSPLCSDAVESFLADNQVVHLTSLPHVPQHNGSAEQAVYDFKRLVADGYTKDEACHILNNNRRRQKLNWQTPAQVEQQSLKLYTKDERTKFYNAASAAKETALLGIITAKEKRKAEREAIFQTMESFSLITRLTGQSTPYTKPEVIA